MWLSAAHANNVYPFSLAVHTFYRFHDSLSLSLRFSLFQELSCKTVSLLLLKPSADTNKTAAESICIYCDNTATVRSLMKSKTTQDREHEENRDFWVHSDAISFYCQTAISLLNSWSFSVTTAEGYFPAASSIFVKWADWIWRHRRKHQKGTARLHMCIWQNAPELPSNGENIGDSIKDKTKKLMYHLSGLFYVSRLVLCLPEFLEFSIIRC